MSASNIPAGTKAAIIRAVVAEKHPKLAMPTIASHFGITYQDLRVIIDKAGYPDAPKMRQAAADLELEEAATDQRDDDVRDQRDTAPARAPRAKATTAAATAVDDSHVDGVLKMVKVADLHTDPDNPRDLPKISDPDIEELADSMVEVGLLQPIVARRHNGLLVIVAGHRRLVAARRLKWTTIDTIIRGPMPDDQVLAAMLIENGQRKDLDPIEEARGLRRLKHAGELIITDAEVAKKVGRTQVHVSNRLALLSLSAEDQAQIRAGQMTLVEGTTKGRLNSGRVRPTGQDKGWHLGPLHGLAQHAKARCQRLGHKIGRKVGGMACGECWESVIRADEREGLHELNDRLGKCVTCDQPVETKSLEGAPA